MDLKLNNDEVPRMLQQDARVNLSHDQLLKDLEHLKMDMPVIQNKLQISIFLINDLIDLLYKYNVKPDEPELVRAQFLIKNKFI